MIRLTELRERTGRHITVLLHEAVIAYHWLLSQSRLCCDNPRLAWNGPIENCSIDCASCGFVLCDDGQLIDWHDPEEIAAEQELAFQMALEDPSEGRGLEGPVPGGHVEGKGEPVPARRSAPVNASLATLRHAGVSGKPQVSLSRIDPEQIALEQELSREEHGQ